MVHSPKMCMYMHVCVQMFVSVICFVVLEIKIWIFCMISKGFSTELYPQSD